MAEPLNQRYTEDNRLTPMSLKDSEAMYRSLFGNMLNGYAHCRMLFDDTTPVDFIYLNVNDAFEKQTGLKNVIGRRVSEVIPGIRESDPGLLKIYGRVALTGIPEQFEIYVESLDQWYWISVYSPAREHFVAVFDVISERKRSEEAREATVELLRICNAADSLPVLLQELMDFFRRLTGCGSIGVRLRDGDDFPYYVTSGFSEEFVLAEKHLCSYDQQGELLRDDAGHPTLDCMCGNVLCGRFDPAKNFFTPHGSFWSSCTSELLASTNDAERMVKTRNRCNGEGFESVALLPFRYRDEIYGLFQFNDKMKGRFNSRNIDLYEGLVNYVAIAMAKLLGDVALKESNERFQMIFEHSIDAIMLARTDGSILAANPESCRLFAMDEAKICRIGRKGLVDGNDPRVASLLEEREQTGSCRGEITMVRGDGSHFPAEISSAVFSDSEGAKKTSLIIRDVTERKDLENQLRHAQKLEAVGTLAGGIAHDFNNILSAIIGFASIMEMKMPPDDIHHNSVRQILTAAERAAQLTRSLLDFSRKEPVKLEPTDLNQTIIDAEKLIRKLLREDVELRLELTASSLFVLADLFQMEQVLLNLAANARDAIQGKGRVTIGAEVTEIPAGHRGPLKPGRYALVTVSDTGRGMDERTRERIFEPFFTTKEVGKGTGLGLSVAYGIIQQHNGQIFCSSEPEKETSFAIYLPLCDDTPEIKPATELSRPPRGNSELILFVEDDVQIRELYRMVLEGAGYRVLVAADGEESIASFDASSDEVAMAIIDVVMPKMNGREVLKYLRQHRPDIKVLFTSGYPADVFGQEDMLRDGLDFIAKPTTPALLLEKIRGMLDR